MRISTKIPKSRIPKMYQGSLEGSVWQEGFNHAKHLDGRYLFHYGKKGKTQKDKEWYRRFGGRIDVLILEVMGFNDDFADRLRNMIDHYSHQQKKDLDFEEFEKYLVDEELLLPKIKEKRFSKHV